MKLENIIELDGSVNQSIREALDENGGDYAESEAVFYAGVNEEGELIVFDEQNNEIGVAKDDEALGAIFYIGETQIELNSNTWRTHEVTSEQAHALFRFGWSIVLFDNESQTSSSRAWWDGIEEKEGGLHYLPEADKYFVSMNALNSGRRNAAKIKELCGVDFHTTM